MTEPRVNESIALAAWPSRLDGTLARGAPRPTGSRKRELRPPAGSGSGCVLPLHQAAWSAVRPGGCTSRKYFFIAQPRFAIRSEALRSLHHAKVMSLGVPEGR